MKRTKQLQSEIGMLYQYGVTTLLAAELSENNQIADYVIYSSENSAGKFDDVVARIKLKDRNDWYLSLIQVKYKHTKKLNVSDTLKGTRIERFLSDYIQCCYEILDNPQLTCRQGIPSDNIRFAIFCDKGIQMPVFLRQDCTFQLKVCSYSEKNDINNIVLPFGRRYSKFVCKDLENSEHQLFFNRCCLFLEQPNSNTLNKQIGKVCAINNAKEIINYVKDFFNIDYLYEQGLSKQVFEMELQRIRVFDVIPPITALVDLADDARVNIWNNMTLEHDITAVNRMQDFLIEPCLYSCVIHRINTLLDINIGWETYNRLDRAIIRKFIKHSKSKRVRYWIEPPNTLNWLIIELWKCGDLPLILRTHTILKDFERYAHLKRSYVIIDDWNSRSEEVSTSKLNIFNSLGSVANFQLQDMMLKCTFVSLQGRKPVSLKDLLIDDTELMSTFACADVLRMMRKRTPFLRRDYFKGSNYLAFIVEDDQCKEISERIEPYAVGHNITVSHPPNKANECLKIIKKHPAIYENYTIYRLQQIGGKLALIDGDPSKLHHLFVDQYGDALYTSINNESISIIGPPIAPNELQYVRRKLKRPTLRRSYISSEETQICFVSGDLDFIEHNLKISDADNITDETISANKKAYFVNIDEKEKRKIYWDKLCELGYPILDIHVKDGILNLLRFQHCKNLEQHITYDGAKYSENEFVGDITDDINGISVITGDAGMGKTSFLKWLCNNYSTRSYIIFYDLINLQSDLNKAQGQKINLIEFIFKNVQKNLKNKYLDFVNSLWKKKRLIWVLDSFDEIRLACERQVLDFIHVIAKSGAQIIIASRIENVKVLMDEFAIQLTKIEPLEEKECFLHWQLNTNLVTDISFQLLTNPLYLNFLKMISVDQQQLLNITKFSLHEKVINMNIRRCLHRTYQILYDSEVERTMELFEKLALVAMFGKEVVEQELYWIVDNEVSDMTKFGIIVCYNEDAYPVFYHRSFVEFLVAQWMTKACKVKTYKNAARYFYKQLLNANKLHVLNVLFEDIKLHEAIFHGTTEKIQNIIQNDPTCWNVVDKLGRTGLHAAAIICGHTNDLDSYTILELIATSMLQIGYDMNKPDLMNLNWYEYVRPEVLEFAYEFNHIEMIKVFLQFLRKKVERDNCANPVFPTKYFYELLLRAITINSFDIIADLVFLQNFGNNKFRNFYAACIESEAEGTLSWTEDAHFDGNLTVLHVASIYGSASMIRHLIEIGADMNAVDAFSYTPLHYSIMRCRLSSFENNRNINDLQMPSGRNKNIDAVKLLLQPYRSVLYDVNKYNYLSPLCLAVRSRDINVVKLVLDNGPDTGHHWPSKDTPLHFAAMLGSLDIVRCLLDHKAPRLFKNESGETAMDIALKQNHTEIVELLKGSTDNAENTQESDRRPVFVGQSIFPDPETAPLCDAMYSDNINLVKVLLRRRYDINVRNSLGETPLFWALSIENTQAITLLLDRGADVNVKDRCGSTPLYIAAAKHDINVIRMLLERGADVNVVSLKKNTPLVNAVLHNDVSCVQFLLEMGAKTDLRDDLGFTSLHHAVYNRLEDKVQVLLENGANTEIQCIKGYTPLHLSIWFKYKRISKFLIEKGANTNVYTKDGRTPLLLAALKQDIDTMRLLLERETKLDCGNVHGYTALHIAIVFGNENIARLLFAKGADINVQNKKGQSILYVAAANKRIHILRRLLEANVNLDRIGEAMALELVILAGDMNTAMLLISKGVNVNLCKVDGYTPLHLAAEKGQSLIVNLLLEQGARVNSNTNLGCTPLHYAVDGMHENTVQLLISRGADANAKTKNGDTCLLSAIKRKSINIIKLLLEANVDIDRETYIEVIKLTVCIGNVDNIKLVLSKTARVNICNEDSYIIFYLAALRMRTDIIELLLEKTVDMNSEIGHDVASFYKFIKDEHGNLARLLNEAHESSSKLTQGYKNIVKILIEDAAAILTTENTVTISFPMDVLLKLSSYIRAPTTNCGNILLRLGARKRNVDVVEHFLNKETSIITDTDSGTTILHDCAREGIVNIMTLLLEKKLDVDIQDNIGNTPLHIAVMEENADVVGLLLDANANVHVTNYNHETALHLAVHTLYEDTEAAKAIKKGGNIEIICLLLENMSNIDIDDENVVRIIYWAVVQENSEIIKLLFKKCANVLVLPDQNNDYKTRKNINTI